MGCWTSTDILSEAFFLPLPFFLIFFSCLVLYLLYTRRETEERMTQIERTNEEERGGAEVKKARKSGIERKGGRRWQSRNLLATPASCQYSVETDTFFPFPHLSLLNLSSAFFSLLFFSPPVKRKGEGIGGDRQEHVMQAGSEAVSHVCLLVSLCVCVSVCLSMCVCLRRDSQTALLTLLGFA